MFRELFEAKGDVNHSFEPFMDQKYDQWNNPGQVMNILRMKTLSKKQARDIVSGRYNSKLDLDMMMKKGYVNISGDEVSLSKFGKEVLQYLSGHSKNKPKGY